MPDEREVLKEFISMMSEEFLVQKHAVSEEYKKEFLDADKETEQFYFPGIIAIGRAHV